MNKNKNQIRTGFHASAIVTKMEAKRIAIFAIPSSLSDKEKDKYLEANVLTVYMLTNVWLMLTEEFSERTMYNLKRCLLTYGLSETIKISDELANALVHEESELSSYAGYPVWYDCFARIGDQPTALRTVLELLRFPKRYSPAQQTDVEQEGLKKFYEINATRRYDVSFKHPVETSDRNCPRVKYDDNYFIHDLTNAVYDIIKGTALDWEWYGPSKAMLLRYTDDPHVENQLVYPTHDLHIPTSLTSYQYWFRDILERIGFFSTGATFELGDENATLLNKLKILKKCMPYYRFEDFPWNNQAGVRASLGPCKVVAVPKSYKTPRIIAKEPAFRNFLASGLRAVVTSQLSTYRPKDWQYMKVDDQSDNREVAWASSFDPKYATVDLSSASDSISAGLGCTLFPLFTKVPWLRASSLQIREPKELMDGSTTSSHIFLTSGHPLTFICETIIFLAFARVATDYTKLFYDKRYRFVEPRSFGDDVEIDCRAFDMLVSLLEDFGFTVNVDKSFTSPLTYRESCGEEYLNGYPMHGVKWPRTTFDWTKKDKVADYVSSLISLQHSLYSRSWKVEDFLNQVICELCPTMTFSQPYSEFDDLWSTIERAQVVDAPHKSKAVLGTSDCYSREIHAVLQGQYQADPKDLNNQALEIYLYERFLRYGPVFQDPLSELLKVSDPVDRRALVTKPKNRWVRVRR